jgi:heme-degrading monooxygenase HmoA
MVLEHALIDVTPDREDAFEEAFDLAVGILAASPGFRGARLHRGIELPSRYLLLVEWERLEDHLEGFRKSPSFTEWRAVLGPFFASPPAVDHYQSPRYEV